MNRISLLGKNYIIRKQSEFQRIDRLTVVWGSYFERISNRYSFVKERVEHFSPLGTLKRGYSVLRNKNKQVLTSVQNVNLGENLEVFLSDGKLSIEVRKKESI